LKQTIIDLYKIDQKWRKLNNKWFNRNFRKGLENKFDLINKKHILFLDSIFRIKAYPGIWLIGVGNSIDSINPSLNNSNLSEMSKIFLYHYDSAYINYNSFLKSEIDKGHISPRTYAMIRDFRDRHLVRNDDIERMYYNIWWKRTNYTEQEFKYHCNSIGCPTKQSLRELNKKLGKAYDVFWYPFR